MCLKVVPWRANLGGAGASPFLTYVSLRTGLGDGGFGVGPTGVWKCGTLSWRGL